MSIEEQAIGVQVLNVGIDNYMNNSLGSKNKYWKGMKADYSTKHIVLRRHNGNPKKCEMCGIVGKKLNGRWTIEWANISGNYKRNINDYKGLCKKCHCRFDGIKKDFKHGTVAKYREKCRCELCRKAKHLYRNGLLEYSRKVN